MPVTSAKRLGIFPLTHVKEHLASDRASHTTMDARGLIFFLAAYEREDLWHPGYSHIFKHLHTSKHCRASSSDCFHVLDHASTGFQLKIKEAIHIQREQPSLNQQLHHVNLKLSL